MDENILSPQEKGNHEAVDSFNQYFLKAALINVRIFAALRRKTTIKGTISYHICMEELISMEQLSFTDAEFSNRRKATKRELFLQEMESIIPFDEWVSIIKPHYYSNTKGASRLPSKPCSACICSRTGSISRMKESRMGGLYN